MSRGVEDAGRPLSSLDEGRIVTHPVRACHTRERLAQPSLAPAAAMPARTVDIPIAYTEFVAGTRRSVIEDARGQYVVDDDGLLVCGVSLIPREDVVARPKLNRWLALRESAHLRARIAATRAGRRHVERQRPTIMT